MKYCNVVGHGGSAWSTKPGEVPSLWRCAHGTCGGIQAWRAHIEETLRDLLAEEHRWQKHYDLPLTPLPWVRVLTITEEDPNEEGQVQEETDQASRA